MIDDTAEEIRVCKKCNESKPINQYYKGHKRRSRFLTCIPCYNKQRKESELKMMNDPEKRAETLARRKIAQQKYRLKHRERIGEKRRARQREYSLKFKFNLTLEEYNDILKRQQGKCAICGHFPETRNLENIYTKGKALAVDHCHKTNKVRGLLCDMCNRAVGQLKDNPVFFRIGAEYLEEFYKRIERENACFS